MTDRCKNITLPRIFGDGGIQGGGAVHGGGAVWEVVLFRGRGWCCPVSGGVKGAGAVKGRGGAVHKRKRHHNTPSHL